MKKHILLLVCIIALGVLLRWYRLGENPPSLYWDEVSLGYNAFSILTTGHDEHGEYYPLDRFIAFGDYKPPGYIYADVIPISLFGLTSFAVRAPSALAGSVMILLTYGVVLEIIRSRRVALLASLLFAISPWSIQLSRAAFEANLASCFNVAAIYFFLLSRKKGRYVLVSCILFIASFYTFNANRIISPLLLGVLVVVYWKRCWEIKRWMLISAILSASLIYPSISFLSSRESRLRYDEVTIFTNPKPVEDANARIQREGGGVLAKIVHNRRIGYAIDFMKHYTDNISGRFLFTHGDKNPRLHVQDMGELYLFELPFIVVGIIAMIRTRSKEMWIVFFWMIISLIPAGVARETPHALRILSILPTYQLLAAYGFSLVWIWWDKHTYKGLCIGLCSLLLTGNMYYYLHHYYVHYPLEWSGEWQYGYKEMVQTVSSLQDYYDHIFITPGLGRPYINYLFYQAYPVNTYLQKRKAERDWYGFWDVSSIGNVSFRLDGLNTSTGKILLITQDTPPPDFHQIKDIKNLSGDVVFYISDKK